MDWWDLAPRVPRHTALISAAEVAEGPQPYRVPCTLPFYYTILYYTRGFGAPDFTPLDLPQKLRPAAFAPWGAGKTNGAGEKRFWRSGGRFYDLHRLSRGYPTTAMPMWAIKPFQPPCCKRNGRLLPPRQPPCRQAIGAFEGGAFFLSAILPLDRPCRGPSWPWPSQVLASCCHSTPGQCSPRRICATGHH